MVKDGLPSVNDVCWPDGGPNVILMKISIGWTFRCLSKKPFLTCK